MIASLGMYDFPWLRAANDRLWTAIALRLREAGIDAIPDALTRGVELDEIWRSPDLLLAQACGYPLMTELRESVQIVATPVYGVLGCDHASHRAALIVRTGDPARALGDLRGRRAALNGPRSNTGMNLFRAAVALEAGRGPAFFAEVVSTGSHARSVAAILSRRADIASIDAVSLAHLRHHYPRHADKIRVLAWTSPSPGLPLITSSRTPPATVAALRDALVGIGHQPALRAALSVLRITRFDLLDLHAYATVVDLEAQAVTSGYTTLQ